MTRQTYNDTILAILESTADANFLNPGEASMEYSHVGRIVTEGFKFVAVEQNDKPPESIHSHVIYAFETSEKGTKIYASYSVRKAKFERMWQQMQAAA